MRAQCKKLDMKVRKQQEFIKSQKISSVQSRGPATHYKLKAIGHKDAIQYLIEHEALSSSSEERVQGIIDSLRYNPESFGNEIAEDSYKRRIDLNFRILYTIDKATHTVTLEIEKHKKADRKTKELKTK